MPSWKVSRLKTQVRFYVSASVCASLTCICIVDVASGIEFPNKLSIGTRLNIPKLQLLGVGIRTVSFLGIQVYSVGFYADLSNPKLQVSPKLCVMYLTCVLIYFVRYSSRMR